MVLYVSKLRAAVRAPGTMERYRQAVGRFAAWCKVEKVALGSARETDSALQLFADTVFEERGGGGRSLVVSVLCGLIAVRPELRRRLPGIHEALRGWHKLRPVESHPPMAVHLAVAVAEWLARRGEWEAAAAVIIAREGLLRKGECLGLTRSSVGFPEDGRLADGKETLLWLPRTKGGRNQSVLLQPGPAVTLLRLLVARTGDRAALFTISGSRLSALFKAACRALRLSSSYVFHSLRHGRATELFRAGMPLMNLKLVGRWASTRACETYVQAGVGLGLAREVPPRLGRRARIMARDPLRWIRRAMQRAAEGTS